MQVQISAASLIHDAAMAGEIADLADHVADNLDAPMMRQLVELIDETSTWTDRYALLASAVASAMHSYMATRDLQVPTSEILARLREQMAFSKWETAVSRTETIEQASHRRRQEIAIMRDAGSLASSIVSGDHLLSSFSRWPDYEAIRQAVGEVER